MERWDMERCGQPPRSLPTWAISAWAWRGEFILSFQGEEAGKQKEREHQSNFLLDFKLHNNILSMWEKIQKKPQTHQPISHFVIFKGFCKYLNSRS